MSKVTKLYKKTQRKGLIPSAVGGILTLGGIFGLMYPLMSNIEMKDFISDLILLAVAGVALIAGFCLLVSGLTQLIIRPYSLVFTNEGLYDFTGKHKNGMFVEWNNIREANIYGKNELAFLGIDLISMDVAHKTVSSKDMAEMEKNISGGMPALIIKQQDVPEPLVNIAKEVLTIRFGDKAEQMLEKMEDIQETEATAQPEAASEKVVAAVAEEALENTCETVTEQVCETVTNKACETVTEESVAEEIEEPEVEIQESAVEELYEESVQLSFDDQEQVLPEDVKEEPIDTDDILEILLNTKKDEKPDVPGENKKEQEVKEQAPQKPKTPSIDDLLSMLSIGDDK